MTEEQSHVSQRFTDSKDNLSSTEYVSFSPKGLKDMIVYSLLLK